MYIVAIAWLYVAFMMAITSESVLGGLSVFVFYGLLPCSLVMYLLATPLRRKAIMAREAQETEEKSKVLVNNVASKPPPLSDAKSETPSALL